ncbi:MAG: Xaa-Pro dipeptidase, partial [Acidobacteria bacterium]|nr:Xaa-Pro dipeptidase [Acidobacteriota bacterium]
EAASELRLLKDEWEIEQMKVAIAATVNGFEDVVKSLPRAMTHPRGERVVEGTFFARAREEGNELGYDTIAAAGNNATVLHWIRNNGQVNAGDLLLLDAGMEAESLYTADITRTLPVTGEFSEVQRKVYQAVLDASDAAFKVAVPGTKFRDVHTAAMEVLTDRLAQWGLLPVSPEEAMAQEGQQHRRWMPHGTSHHLGMDVHDCAQAKRELYLDGIITEGMVFTIEPGLYFKEEDLAVPEEYRGIGVRIEDDILITKDGAVNLSSALPRTPDDVQTWMKGIWEA